MSDPFPSPNNSRTRVILPRAAPPEDGFMTQREAARLLGVGVSYLRASSCPKYLLPGNGPRGRPLLRYRRDEVLAWARGERQPSAVPAGDAASSEGA